MTRTDGAGKPWTLAKVEHAVILIVARKAGMRSAKINRGSRFDDLGWDDVYRLTVLAPIEKRLHEKLKAGKVQALRTVGGLVDMVWAAMEPAA